jgi:hypothetical protein
MIFFLLLKAFCRRFGPAKRSKNTVFHLFLALFYGSRPMNTCASSYLLDSIFYGNGHHPSALRKTLCLCFAAETAFSISATPPGVNSALVLRGIGRS